MSVVAYSQRSGIVATVAPKTPAVMPSAAKPSPLNAGTGKVALWGANNDFPQQVYEEGKANSLICGTIEEKAALLVGRRLQYGRYEKGKFVELDLPEVDDFLKKAKVRKYLNESAIDLYWFANFFPELILSKDRKQVVCISRKPAMHTRLEKQQADGFVHHVYLNADWQGASELSKQTLRIPTLDTRLDAVEWLKSASGYKYVFPLSFPKIGEHYYATATWDSVRKSGWLELAAQIPHLKKKLLENQMVVKYHVQIAEEWLTSKYKDWKDIKEDERNHRVQQLLDDFDKKMTGTNAVGNSLISTFRLLNGKEYSGWKIEPIKGADNLDGIYQEDGKTANEHILFALGMPSSLKDAPGKNSMGAGSGSNIREIINVYLSKIKTHEDLLLEPIQFMHDYNGLPKGIVYRFEVKEAVPQNQKSPKQRGAATTNLE